MSDCRAVAESAATPKRCFLIVTDHVFIAEALQALLSMCGPRRRHGVGAAGALDRAQTFRPTVAGGGRCGIPHRKVDERGR